MQTRVGGAELQTYAWIIFGRDMQEIKIEMIKQNKFEFLLPCLSYIA